jgi:hypothetical protein
MNVATIQWARQSNRYFADAVSALDGFDVAIGIAEDARKLLKDRTVDTAHVPSPLQTGTVSVDWLEAATAERMAMQRTEFERQVLLQLIDNADREAESIFSVGADEMLAHLNGELAAVVDAVTAAELDGATTAAQAVDRGTAEAWRKLGPLVQRYDEIRRAQDTVMRQHPEYVARARSRFADTADNHANDLYIRNLDQVWAGWNKPHNVVENVDGTPHRFEPWPADPAERLLWLATSDAEPWCPTLGDLDELSARRIPIRTASPHTPKLSRTTQLEYRRLAGRT